jgi:hypothetical protein
LAAFVTPYGRGQSAPANALDRAVIFVATVLYK